MLKRHVISLLMQFSRPGLTQPLKEQPCRWVTSLSYVWQQIHLNKKPKEMSVLKSSADLFYTACIQNALISERGRTSCSRGRSFSY